MLASELGSHARCRLSGVAAQHISETFPIGALIGNVTGSFVIGFFATLTGPDERIFAAIRRRREARAVLMRFNIHGIGFTAFLAALTALPPLAIDMALPSLGLIQADFGATQTQAASAIAIFLAGFSTAPLVVGPLADRFGRKPVMLAGILLFTLCAAGCALAPSITALLAFRLFQGVGAGAVGVLPRAIIRDLFDGMSPECTSPRFR